MVTRIQREDFILILVKKYEKMHLDPPEAPPVLLVWASGAFPGFSPVSNLRAEQAFLTWLSPPLCCSQAHELQTPGILPGLLFPTAGDEHILQGVYLRQSELEIKVPFPRDNLCGKQNQVALCKLIGPITKVSCMKFPLKQLAPDYLSARQALTLKR